VRADRPCIDDTVLIAVTPLAPPSCAALAIASIDVMLGVILAKNGIFTAARTHSQIDLTNDGVWPHAKPIPFCAIPYE
jgi:hypothetical protein